MKLWNKDNTATHAIVEKFTVGRDRGFDVQLAVCDVYGSIAHPQMLATVGLLSPEECKAVEQGLQGGIVDHVVGKAAQTAGFSHIQGVHVCILGALKKV